MSARVSCSLLIAAGLIAAPVASVSAAPAANMLAIDVGAEVQPLSDQEMNAFIDGVKEALVSNDARAIQMAFYRGGLIYRGLANNRAVSDEQVETITETLSSLASEYPDHAELIEKETWKIENLTIGRVAPNIKGVDTDEVEFELKDYRGKVIVIDFWGDW